MQICPGACHQVAVCVQLKNPQPPTQARVELQIIIRLFGARDLRMSYLNKSVSGNHTWTGVSHRSWWIFHCAALKNHY